MHPVAPQQHGLSPEELRVCDVMGIAPRLMAEQKACRQGTSAHAAALNIPAPHTVAFGHAMPLPAQPVRMVRSDQLTPQAYLDSLTGC